MKHLSIAIVLILGTLAISSSLNEPLSIGYVDLELVISKTDDGQNMTKTLKDLEQRHKEETDKINALINSKTQWLDSEESRRKSEDIDREDVEAELKEMKAQLKKKEENFAMEYAKTKRSLRQSIETRVRTVVETVGAKKGFKMVLNRTDSEGDLIVVSAPQDNDITAEVLKNLGY